jgi:hypothetical protein
MFGRSSDNLFLITYVVSLFLTNYGLVFYVAINIFAGLQKIKAKR